MALEGKGGLTLTDSNKKAQLSETKCSTRPQESFEGSNQSVAPPQDLEEEKFSIFDGEHGSEYDEYARFFLNLEEPPKEPVTAQPNAGKELLAVAAGCPTHEDLAYGHSAQFETCEATDTACNGRSKST